MMLFLFWIKLHAKLKKLTIDFSPAINYLNIPHISFTNLKSLSNFGFFVCLNERFMILVVICKLILFQITALFVWFKTALPYGQKISQSSEKGDGRKSKFFKLIWLQKTKYSSGKTEVTKDGSHFKSWNEAGFSILKVLNKSCVLHNTKIMVKNLLYFWSVDNLRYLL